MRNDYISDELYKEISDLAYQDNVTAGAPLTEEGDYAQWKVIEPEGAELHNKVSGFDSVILHNNQTNQIVIGYRGTEPGGSWLGRAYRLRNRRVRCFRWTHQRTGGCRN